MSRYRIDTHLHTTFSPDSDAEPDVMLNAAGAEKMSYICFTDHIDYDFPDPEVDMVFDFEPERYFEKMREIRKKAAAMGISAGIGVEMGFLPREEVLNKINRTVSTYPFDYCIASVHVVFDRDPYYRTVWKQYSPKEIYTKYFEDTLFGVRNLREFDALGHLDYICRYEKANCGTMTYRSRDYEDIIEEILRTLVERDKALECNFAGLARGLDLTNPGREVFLRYRELGGEKITIGSDAHMPKGIGKDAYLRAVQMLAEECGFRYAAYFAGRKAQMIPIA